MKLNGRSVATTPVIITLVLVFPLVHGCTVEPEPSNPFHELLGLIPSETDLSGVPIYLNDYASFYEDNDISLVTADNRPVTFEEFTDIIRSKEIRIPAMAEGSYITGWSVYASQGNIQTRYLGYNFTNVDAEIHTGAPPSEITAAIGRFDPKATRDALSRQDEWLSWVRDAYTTEEYKGVTVHSWGSGYEVHFESMFTPPHVDMIGRARPIAVTSYRLFYAPLVDTVKSMIDASQDRTESLADLPEYSMIADELSEFHVYSAMIGIESMANGNPEYEGTYPGPRMKKFVTFGMTSGEDENGTYLAIVIYHENPADARSNISLLEQRIESTSSVMHEIPWREMVTDTDIRAEGNLLVAKLYTEYIGIWENWIYAQEPLLLHES